MSVCRALYLSAYPQAPWPAPRGRRARYLFGRHFPTQQVPLMAEAPLAVQSPSPDRDLLKEEVRVTDKLIRDLKRHEIDREIHLRDAR